MIRKYNLDNAIARDYGVPKVFVTKVTEAFLRHIREALAKEGAVHLDGLGRLQVYVHEGGERFELTKGTLKKGQTAGKTMVKVPFKVHVHFKKAEPLKALLAKAVRRRRRKS